MHFLLLALSALPGNTEIAGPMSVAVGESFQLVCSASGYPPPNIEVSYMENCGGERKYCSSFLTLIFLLSCFSSDLISLWSLLLGPSCVIVIFSLLVILFTVCSSHTLFSVTLSSTHLLPSSIHSSLSSSYTVEPWTKCAQWRCYT